MRSVIALDPRRFGRGRRQLPDVPRSKAPSPGLADDLWLFATTFLGGFLFVAVYLI